MQIPILSGIYVDTNADLRTSYPRNMIPVPKSNGISKGYLRPADGIVQLATGPGIDRGGINWNNKCYRVMGSKLCLVAESGIITQIGDVGTDNLPVTMTYSFDRLAIASGNRLFYYDGATITQVNDGDLGNVVSLIWVDGYFMTTDGTSLVVTELNDPYSVNPLKYGSSEADPDSIVGIVKIRNDPWAVNRYTTEVFSNICGTLFPFQRITGAQIMRGAVGSHAFCVFQEQLAFLGSGKNEPCAVWMGINAQSSKISTREIDTIIQQYTDAQLKRAVVEARVDKGHQFLYVHLPDQTLVYDASASAAVGDAIWFTLTTSLNGKGTYKARNLVWAYNKWIVGDPTSFNLGYFVNNISSHYGNDNGWEFGTLILFNETNGLEFHELELVCITGNVEIGKKPVVWTSYTTDGVSWSMERQQNAGLRGDKMQRINWLQQGNMQNWRIQKFRGTSVAHISPMRLEATIEPLYV